MVSRDARSSSAVVSVPPSNQAGNGGRRGPKIRRGRSPPLAVGGPRLGCTRMRRSESGIDRIASGSAPLRPFQSEDSGELSVYLRSRAPGTVAHCKTVLKQGLKNTVRLLGGKVIAKPMNKQMQATFLEDLNSIICPSISSLKYSPVPLVRPKIHDLISLIVVTYVCVPKYICTTHSVCIWLLVCICSQT